MQKSPPTLFTNPKTSPIHTKRFVGIVCQVSLVLYAKFPGHFKHYVLRLVLIL